MSPAQGHCNRIYGCRQAGPNQVVTDRARVIQSFVARIWLERGTNGDPQWRGHIQHIQGQEEVYFQDLAELGEFLERISGLPASGISAATGDGAQVSETHVLADGKRKN